MRVLLDTNIWIPWLEAKHPHHHQARRFIAQLGPERACIHPKSQRELGLASRRVQEHAHVLHDAPGFDAELEAKLALQIPALRWPTDLILLLALFRHLVDWLVTDDRAIQQDALAAGVAEHVVSLAKAEQMMRDGAFDG